MSIVITLVVGLGIGFAAGRVKNKAKLAAISAELNVEEGKATAEVKDLISKIKAKL
jgi:hypothetical protein